MDIFDKNAVVAADDYKLLVQGDFSHTKKHSHHVLNQRRAATFEKLFRESTVLEVKCQVKVEHFRSMTDMKLSQFKSSVFINCVRKHLIYLFTVTLSSSGSILLCF